MTDGYERGGRKRQWFIGAFAWVAKSAY